MAISDDFSASADIFAVIGQTADGGPAGKAPVVWGQQSLMRANASKNDIDRKYVTVLVIEIVNPLHAFGGIDPELILRQIDPLLESAREVIELNGGVISTSGESGITAIFGTLPASQHHALSASRAALVVKYKLELQSNGSIRVRAGLDTGEVIVQHRSATNQIEVMGSAVRTATRLAQSLRRGAVAITVRTRVAADGLLNVVRLSRSDLIRFDGDEQAYELKKCKFRCIT